MKRLCLLDMDGTLVDFDKAQYADLQRLASPGETEHIQAPDTFSDNDAHDPPYIKARKRMIKSQPNWWVNLEKYKPGWEIYAILQEFDFRFQVLTKGPHYTGDIWRQKFEWCRNHLGPDMPLTVTEDKSITQASVLVDDWIPYVEPWLKGNPNSLVIMPAHRWNDGFTHPQVVRYTGTNADEVREAIRSRFFPPKKMLKGKCFECDAEQEREVEACVSGFSAWCTNCDEHSLHFGVNMDPERRAQYED